MTRFTHKWKWGGWGWSGIVETIIPEWWTIVGDIQNQTDLIELLYSNIDWWTPSSIPVINALYDWWTP